LDMPGCATVFITHSWNFMHSSIRMTATHAAKEDVPRKFMLQRRILYAIDASTANPQN
jgi:hypothetical protein